MQKRPPLCALILVLLISQHRVWAIPDNFSKASIRITVCSPGIRISDSLFYAPGFVIPCIELMTKLSTVYYLVGSGHDVQIISGSPKYK